MNCIDKQIDWLLYRNDRHGIKNLSMGEKQLSMICKTKSAQRKREINIDSEVAFKLNVMTDDKTKTYQIVPGINRLYF